MTFWDGFDSPGSKCEISYSPRRVSYYSCPVNHKQRTFVAHYLATLNAAEAARRAGYSERRAKQTGSELLADSEVRAAIDAEFEESIPSAAESLARVGARARADMADIAAELGYPQLREARDAGRLDTRAIRKFEVIPSEHGDRIKVELYDSHRADELILKVVGDLEERLTVLYEAEADLFVARLEAAFAGDPAGLAKVVAALGAAS